MDFDISDEQELLQDTVRQYLQNECPLTKVREIFDSDEGYDEAVWKGMVDIGLGGIYTPEEHGGAGLEMLDLALVSEVVGEGAAPGPLINHALASLAVNLAGSDEQKKTWLPKLAMGDALGTIALGEGDGSWQPEEWTLKGNGALSGTKANVPFAKQADLIVVGTANGGLALVEKGASGISIEDQRGVDRTRRISQISFDKTPCEPLPQGQAAARRVRDGGLVLLSADAFGSASKLLELTVEYGKTREQFGVTLGHFQAYKHQLANIAVEVEPMRGLYWYAAHAYDHVQDESERTAAVAKAHVTDVAMQAARDSVEGHGGIGFTWECDVQIYFKRCMFDRAFLGTPADHRERAAVLAGW